MNNMQQDNIHTWTKQGKNYPHHAKIIRKIGNIVFYLAKWE
jgi:hypothetical protein